MTPGRDYALERLAEQPSVPLCQLRAELAKPGVRVSYGALWNFVHVEGLPFKKDVLAAEIKRPDIARRCARWKRHQHRVDPGQLVFIDEPKVRKAKRGCRRTWPRCAA